MKLGRQIKAEDGFGFSDALVASSEALDVLMISSVPLGILISGSLQLLWGMINALQLITHTVLFSLYFPVNVSIAFMSLLKFVAFDMLYTEVFYA